MGCGCPRPLVGSGSNSVLADNVFFDAVLWLFVKGLLLLRLDALSLYTGSVDLVEPVPFRGFLPFMGMWRIKGGAGSQPAALHS